MKAIVRRDSQSEPIVVKHAIWGAEPSGWLVFRNEAGEVCYVIKDWDTIEIVEEDLTTMAPDDAIDAINMKRGFCDC